MRRCDGRWRAALMMACAGLCLAAASASADINRTLATVCPKETVPVTNDLGGACMLPQCQRDEDCPGQVCRDQLWCIRQTPTRDRLSDTIIVIERYLGPCSAEEQCLSGATCIRGPRCSAPGTPYLPPAAPPAEGGCSRRSGAAAMVAPMFWLARPRRRARRN